MSDIYTLKHPCYAADAQHKYARIHLPVAPSCNIQCNYCNRRFDCLHESRPGVTSEVLSPAQAAAKYSLVKKQMPNLTVAGIAGPGDALANWEATSTTLKLLRAVDPAVIFCLATNGLTLPEHAEEIIALGVKHVTVTVNAIDPEIGAKIYQYVNYQSRHWQGTAGAQLLLARQLAGIAALTSAGVLVKVNIVMIKGINDRHIPAVAAKAKELGVFMTNIMPLLPAGGSAFADYPQTSQQELLVMRNRCQVLIKQMRHCQQCRADAVGLLSEDRSAEFRQCKRQTAKVADLPAEQVVAQPSAPELAVKSGQAKYTIAVASKYGKLVDQHFGQAGRFLIYRGDVQEFSLQEDRAVPQFCAGQQECEQEETHRAKTISLLADCDAVLTMRIGPHAREKLGEKGIYAVEYCDAVVAGLRYAAQQMLAAAAFAKPR